MWICVFRWKKRYSIEDALKLIMDGNCSNMEERGEDGEEEEWIPAAKDWRKLR